MFEQKLKQKAEFLLKENNKRKEKSFILKKRFYLSIGKNAKKKKSFYSFKKFF